MYAGIVRVPGPRGHPARVTAPGTPADPHYHGRIIMNTEHDQNEERFEENFEEMLEQSMNRRDDFDVGTKVRGSVVHSTEELVFVDISGKSEAVIPTEEFRSDDGTLSIGVGDAIEAYVVSTSRGEIRLTSGIGKSHAGPALIQLAYREGIPVFGTIQGTVKGGYSVSVGGTRCFCPFSQVDTRAPSDPSSLVNRSFQFKIIEHRERGRNIILSRTALLEEKRKETEETLRETLKPGDVISGTVSVVRDFGVFVDIGGMEALIPKSELSWSRRADTGALRPGDSVKAAVKNVDWESKKISLSVKDLAPDPWSRVDRYEEGQTITGRVVNMIKSGAFVEIEPGVDGFIHVSRMSHVRKVNSPEEAVSRDAEVTARILSINAGERKISLELIPDEHNPWDGGTGDMAKTLQEVTIEEVVPAGVGVRLENGMRGFVPRGELTAKGDQDIMKLYTAGNRMRAAVLRVEPENRKCILSEREALRIEERQVYESFIKKEGASRSTSLGNLLKKNFDDIQKKIEDQ